jgi:hypothetical protein
MIHPLLFISQHFTALPAPVQGGIVSALMSTSIAFVIFVLGYIHTSRPILVFVGRPDGLWKIQNIGRGAAFDVRFEDRSADGKAKRLHIYPIAKKERIELSALDYGDTLTVYYGTRSGWRRYCTTCRNWEHKFVRLWFRKFPKWPDMTDESRLRRPPTTTEKVLADAITSVMGK